MKEYHVTYEVISTEPGLKWKVDNTFHHTQSEAWERCKSLARKARGVAYLHGKDGTIKEQHSYDIGTFGKIDVPQGRAWYEN